MYYIIHYCPENSSICGLSMNLNTYDDAQKKSWTGVFFFKQKLSLC